jgi:hypothetical protein
MTAHISVERDIHGGADDLWACIADLPRMAEWSPENTGATWLEGAGPGAVGGRFKGTNRHGRKTWSTIGTVVASDPGHAFAFRVTVGPLAVSEWRFTFVQTGDTTTVVESWTDLRGGFLRRVAPLFTGVQDRSTHNRTTMEQTLDALKAQAEATTQP